jgi:hypothetical protein
MIDRNDTDRDASPQSAAPEIHVALASMGALPYLAWCLSGSTPQPCPVPEHAPYEWPEMAVIA